MATVNVNGIGRVRRGSNGYLKKQVSRGSKRSWVGLHRYVWERRNGRLRKGYTIHHVDGNKDNNDIANLVVMPKLHQARIHRGYLFLDDGTWLKPCRHCKTHKVLEAFRKPADETRTCKQCEDKWDWTYRLNQLGEYHCD